MATTIITFEEPDLTEGSVFSISKDGTTVRFLRRAAIFRPTVTTQSGAYALRNISQDPYDETGFQKPLIFEFDRLQRRVRVLVGLNDRDYSGEIVARLVAYDALGQEVGSDSRNLGSGPTPINIPLEVRAASDVIQRVLLEYNGLVQEVLDNLEFESDAPTPIPPDTTPPIVTIQRPTEGQVVNSRTVTVQGTIVETNQVSLVINGVSVPVRRSGVNTYEFNTEVTLPPDSNVIEAIATDAAGNVGRDGKTVDTVIPASFSISDIRFTQTGLMDTATSSPTRLVAGKTSLFRVTLQVRTADGRSARVDRAGITLERGGRVIVDSPGQLRMRMQGTDQDWLAPAYASIGDGQQVYCSIRGFWLEAGYPYRVVLRLFIRNQVVFEQTLASNWVFRQIRGITMLLVPQHRPLEAGFVAALMNVLRQTARMYPVPDDIANLDSDERGGIRFAILPPTSYRDHTDPADADSWPIPYEQGFLLRDHNVGTNPGPDRTYGTSDDPFTFQAGEFLPFNFTSAEDANRNGVFDEEELARVRPPGGEHAAKRRYNNWHAFARQEVESRRQSWNRERINNRRQQSNRAIVVITGGSVDTQMRGGWGGNAGSGESSFWAVIGTGQPGYIPHEMGHTFGFDHTDGLSFPCPFSGEVINLLTGRIVGHPLSLMCSDLYRLSDDLFLRPAEYDMMFDRLVTMGGQD
ncbi:hypothetical protein [Leptodesmis sichuanensis]|uniref:hypothetical protein n=1 Tax=Leptodesmis sichuanensis TaxID=2906798 RepID=UPI001F1A70F7|nr:hypothetical protein [Leptodesmis sichuanensis]UIE36659.1 hypothetical protein KIK02_16660 [Leptodesmis sichuanensis A121]